MGVHAAVVRGVAAHVIDEHLGHLREELSEESPVVLRHGVHGPEGAVGLAVGAVAGREEAWLAWALHMQHQCGQRAPQANL